jgi:serine/threonine-protein kinase
MKPTARKRLGKYVLLGRLGHGGMGKIYLAYAPGPMGIEKLLVIKRLHSHLTSDPVLVNNFLDEARLSMALAHPHIVHTYDVGEVRGRYFMVMEYVAGQNLGVVLRAAKRSGNYPESHVWAGLYLGVLDALHAAHTARDARGRPLQIIHRDVSPQNVIVTYDGSPKLVDFGIAKATQRISETDAGVLKGKYSYMSPEQCRSEPLDARSDVFAAGIVLWEMLAGRRLYKSDSVVKSVERIITEAPPSPLRINSDCDEGIARVAMKALYKKPSDRFQTAEEFRHALAEALGATGKRYHSSYFRQLMGVLFADVQERQQALLEQCLADAEADVAAADDDDDDVRGAGSDSHPELDLDSDGSESDLEVPSLRLGMEGETTTPSSAIMSPLVTAEEEEKGPAGAGPRGEPANHELPTIAAPPHLPPATVEVAPRERRRGGLLAAAALALLLVGAGVIAFVLSQGGDEPRGEAVAQVPDAPPPTVTLPSAEPSTPPAVETRPSSPHDEDTPSPSANEAPAAVDEPAQAEPKRPARARRGVRPKSGRRAQQRPPREEPAKAPTPEPTAPPPEEPAAEPAVKTPARLTLQTVPWTIVYLGKKKLGETPIIDVAIPAGEVELLLVNPDENIRQPYLLKAEPGKSYRRRLKLN